MEQAEGVVGEESGWAEPMGGRLWDGGACMVWLCVRRCWEMHRRGGMRGVMSRISRSRG